MKDWKCSIKGCGKPANYHIANLHGHLYYCDEHWAIRMGFKKRNVKVDEIQKHTTERKKRKRSKKRA